MLFYDNMNILLPENIDEFRAKIGICPQHDVLFNDLTIREHLGMFAIFKGVSSGDVESEVNKVINRDRRKLLIGSIAPDISKLVGKSKKDSH